MSEQLVYLKVRSFVGERFPHPLGDHDSLIDCGAIDSLGILDLVAYVETEFGLQSDTADADKNLAAPEGLAVTASGDVLVADTGNDRLVEFSPASGSAAAADARQ